MACTYAESFPNAEMRGLTAVLALVLFQCAAVAADLRIHVRDETGKRVWTRLEVRGPEGRNYRPEKALRDASARNRQGGLPYYVDSFVVEGDAALEVPPGRFTVVAEHGLEYERVEREIQVRSDRPTGVSIALKPWIRMRDLGWWSADMHLHRPPEDAPTLALAEDLNLSVVTTMWNKRNFWEGKGLPAEAVVRVSPHHLVSLRNAEDERGGGAWMMLDIRRLLPLAVDGRWFPPGIQVVRQARAQRPAGGVLPWFDSEKPVWWEVPVMMALETPDSLGLLHNHFNQYGINAAEAWGRPRDQKQFPDRKGFVDYSLGLYYRYLNLGFRLPPSAGSASGVLPSPPGYNRAYVRLEGPLTLEKWYGALHDGPSFVTNGPMLFFSAKAPGGRLTGSVEARAREPIDRVEIVANGRIVASFPGNGTRPIKKEFSLPAENYTWLAARCFLRTAYTVRLAHTSPVYLDGSWDAREDARYFVAWIDELMAQAAADPQRFASASERDQVLALYGSARQFYEKRATTGALVTEK